MPERELLRVVAELAGVTAVALPVLGFISRGIAFRLCWRIGGPGAWHVAAADPLPDLMIAGLPPVLMAIPLYLYALLNTRMFRWSVSASNVFSGTLIAAFAWLRRRLHGHGRLGTAVMLSLGIGALAFAFLLVLSCVVATLLLLLLEPLFSAVISAMGLGVVLVWIALVGRKHTSLRVGLTWPLLIAGLLISACAWGLVYSDVPVGDYIFVPPNGTSSLNNDRYMELGRTDDTVYLLSCTKPDEVMLGVPPATISEVDYVESKTAPIEPASLWDLITGNTGDPVGLQTQCRSANARP